MSTRVFKQSATIFRSVGGNGLIDQYIARCLRLDNFDIVLHHDSGDVAHFECDLSGVFRLLQAIAAEAVSERVSLPFHAGLFGDFRHALARINLEYRAALPAIRGKPFQSVLRQVDFSFAPGFRNPRGNQNLPRSKLIDSHASPLCNSSRRTPAKAIKTM